ncbi:hypothetical protein MIB92_10680 [Aestuariirhabdus sp. Z084]|uniref:hypothetical protein n=1 Tax=Aestuariirhabdus haliotis TaxID=2918751 RepID=UPI00201B3AD4|nr:hypothetical protein [Aestuariirhabdus haliotis]MCL6416119.1 hypothetical protein [Aestuariirhabdus haliotis]MCL6420124.1 hypothetical protein [Aestuariirhabdus haliotis]
MARTPKGMAVTDKAKAAQQTDDVDMEVIGRGDVEAEGRTLESRRGLHEMLDRQVAAYLASGGTITQVDSSLSADPPKKPVSRYGSRPI